MPWATPLPTDTEPSRDIAFRWAKQLQSSSPKQYGEILHYLSAAPLHEDARTEMHVLINSLIHKSLEKAAAYPDDESLDNTLADMLTSPDSVSSEILRFEISGYAALRQYFATNSIPALIAVLRSAGESIDGGVWDTEWNAAVDVHQVPGLLREVEKMGGLGERACFDVVKVVTDLEAAGEGVWREVEAGWEWGKGDGLRALVGRVRGGVAACLGRVWVRGEGEV